MKQWLAIIVLIWAAATVNAAGQTKGTPCRSEICATVFTPESDDDIRSEQAPLLATACSGATQLSGTGHETAKGNRNPASPLITATRGYAVAGLLRSIPRHGSEYVCCPPSVRNADRYIYYLRRIII